VFGDPRLANILFICSESRPWIFGTPSEPWAFASGAKTAAAATAVEKSMLQLGKTQESFAEIESTREVSEWVW
jgi:hypothetical protein